MKQIVYNLIIIDESGSMSGIKRQTVSGCNETINTIKSSQQENAETQEHKISIYAFQSNRSNPSHYIIKNAPAADVSHITDAIISHGEAHLFSTPSDPRSPTCAPKSTTTPLPWAASQSSPTAWRTPPDYTRPNASCA